MINKLFSKKNAGIHLILSVIIGIILPQLSIAKFSLKYILMIIMFFSFLKLDFKMDNFFRKELLVFPLFIWVITPLLFFFFQNQIQDTFKIGLFFILITPPALGSPLITQLTNGNLELTMANVVFYNIISPIAFMLLPFLVLETSNLHLPIFSIFEKISLLILLPFILSLFVRKKHILKKKINDFSNKSNRFFLYFLILIASASASENIKSLNFFNLSKLFLLIFFIVFILYFIGNLLARDKDMKKTLPIVLGHKNSVLAILICLTNFGETAIIPAIFYLFSHHIMNSILIQIYNKSEVKL